MTAISTMIDELMTSFLVGHATLRSSPLTSPRYSLGPIFSRGGAEDGGRRFSSGARDLGLSVPCFAIMRFVCRFMDTAGPSSGCSRSSRHSLQGRRESNPQPPVLETGALPIELLPSGRGRAGRIRIAVGSREGRCGSAPRRKARFWHRLLRSSPPESSFEECGRWYDRLSVRPSLSSTEHRRCLLWQ